MLKFLKSLFGSKPASERHPLDAVTTPNVSASYKVPEEATMITPIPLVVETAPGQVEVVNAAEGSATQTAPAKAKASTKPKTAKPKAAAIKAPAKAKAEKAPAKAKAPAAPKKPKISIAK